MKFVVFLLACIAVASSTPLIGLRRKCTTALCHMSEMNIISINPVKPTAKDQIITNLIPPMLSRALDRSALLSDFCTDGRYWVLASDPLATSSVMYAYNTKTNKTSPPSTIKLGNITTFSVDCKDGSSIVTVMNHVYALSSSGNVTHLTDFFDVSSGKNNGGISTFDPSSAKLMLTLEDPTQGLFYMITVDVTTAQFTTSPGMNFTQEAPYIHNMVAINGTAVLAVMGSILGPSVFIIDSVTAAVNVLVPFFPYFVGVTCDDGADEFYADIHDNVLYFGVTDSSGEDNQYPAVTTVNGNNKKNPVTTADFTGTQPPTNWAPLIAASQ